MLIVLFGELEENLVLFRDTDGNLSSIALITLKSGNAGACVGKIRLMMLELENTCQRKSWLNESSN